VLRELGHVPRDGVVERERAALPLLQHRDRHRRLRHREPGDHCVAGHLHAGALLTQREVGHELAVVLHHHEGTRVQAALDTGAERRDCPRQRLRAGPPDVHESNTWASCDCCHAWNMAA
jgi:hypothetical protein